MKRSHEKRADAPREARFACRRNASRGEEDGRTGVSSGMRKKGTSESNIRVTEDGSQENLEPGTWNLELGTWNLERGTPLSSVVCRQKES